MKNSIGNRGFIKTLLVLLVLGGIVTGLLIFAKPYYRHYTLGSLTRDFLKTHVDLAAVKSNVLKDAADLGIKLNESDVSVEFRGQFIKVKASWKDTADLWGFYQKTFDFVMEEEY